jgi:hypothetical protein
MRRLKTLLSALAPVAIGALALALPLNATAQATGCPPAEGLSNFLPSSDIGVFQTHGFAFGDFTPITSSPRIFHRRAGCPV